MLLSNKIRDISSLTNHDYASIASTFITMSEPKYRCADCKLRHKNEPTRRDKLESAMACKSFVDKPRHNYLPEYNNKDNPKIMYRKCIGNYFNNYWASIINMSDKWDNGIMPFSGSYYDQPAKFVEVMNLIYNLRSENQHKISQKEKNLKQKINGK